MCYELQKKYLSCRDVNSVCSQLLQVQQKLTKQLICQNSEVRKHSCLELAAKEHKDLKKNLFSTVCFLVQLS